MIVSGRLSWHNRILHSGILRCLLIRRRLLPLLLLRSSHLCRLQSGGSLSKVQYRLLLWRRFTKRSDKRLNRLPLLLLSCFPLGLLLLIWLLCIGRLRTSRRQSPTFQVGDIDLRRTGIAAKPRNQGIHLLPLISRYRTGL